MNNRNILVSAHLICLLLLVGCSDGSLQSSAATPEAASTPGTLDRTVLPIQPPKHQPITEMDARNATKPPRFEIKPPEGAPNVVIVLIDDIGFGATSPFGGAIETPTFERLADEGLRFNRVPHHRAVFADASLPAVRPQPS